MQSWLKFVFLETRLTRNLIPMLVKFRSNWFLKRKLKSQLQSWGLVSLANIWPFQTFSSESVGGGIEPSRQNCGGVIARLRFGDTWTPTRVTLLQHKANSILRWLDGARTDLARIRMKLCSLRRVGYRAINEVVDLDLNLRTWTSKNTSLPQ